jgi:APA family basic amino acid/polyamine antiporter
MTSKRSQAALGTFDFTLLVIGAVIGADIYVVAGVGASLLGPAQLVAWLIAGALAAIIALTFVQCSAIEPAVGGSYAYAREAFGPLIGFVSGWALYVGECIALPVFPLVFVNYLQAVTGALPDAALVALKVALIAVVTATNLAGVRQGARLNDVLSVAKLLPLAALILVGAVFLASHSTAASDNLTPFAPHGWGSLGKAVLPIFWAYAGFELAVLPAGEVRNPGTTLPRGLMLGMAIASAFYLLTVAALVIGLPSAIAAGSPSSLADAMKAMLQTFGAPGAAGTVLIGLGAAVSIVGVFDVYMLGVARLSLALASDGLFPSAFGWRDSRFDSPYVGLVFQAVVALVGSLVLDLRGLVSIAVVFLSVPYFFTALAALRLIGREPEKALKIPGLRAVLGLAALAGLFLAAEASASQAVAGLVALGAGLVLYGVRRQAWSKTAAALVRDERRAVRWFEHHHWLARSLTVRDGGVRLGAERHRPDE